MARNEKIFVTKCCGVLVSMDYVDIENPDEYEITYTKKNKKDVTRTNIIGEEEKIEEEITRETVDETRHTEPGKLINPFDPARFTEECPLCGEEKGEVEIIKRLSDL